MALIPAILLALGSIAFAAVVAVLIIRAVALIVPVPYYFMTKPTEVRPESSTTLDLLRER